MVSLGAGQKMTISEENSFRNYTLKIYDKIDEPELVKGWKHLVKENDYFPQSSYGWCAAWWKRLSKGLKLHLVTAYNDKGEILGIAPLCIENKFGLRSLRSFPIHFADFYTFIIRRDKEYDVVFKYLMAYVQSFDKWDMVRLDQINTEDRISLLLSSMGLSSKKLTEIIVVDFQGMIFDDFLQSLSSNRRKDLAKKSRRLERDCQRVELVRAQNYNEYESYFDTMKELYDARWSDDVVVLSSNYYECRKEAVKACFDDGRMLLYVLKTDRDVIAYHLGFVADNTFYTWKEGHNPSYSYYSPGALIRYYFIRDLIKEKYSRVNFMAGDYEFKRTFAKGGRTTTNYLFLSAKRSLRGWILLHYYMQWRDTAKRQYHKLQEYSWFRKIVRKTI